MEGMNHQVTVHPDADQLQRFAQGRLPATEASALEAHLSVCESCCRFLESAPGDSFLNRLREALGLAHAHERGMVHRDIKPHNLMLTPVGQVKVLDFGMARFASEASGERGALRGEEESQPSLTLPAREAQRLTGVGAVLGTADYIAPEQARDAHVADGRSDIYSLGCTLYHLVTGRPPFPEGSAREKLLLHSSDAPASMFVFRLDIPEGLGRVVARMMAKKQEDRYQTAAEAADALRRFSPREDQEGARQTGFGAAEQSPGEKTARYGAGSNTTKGTSSALW